MAKEKKLETMEEVISSINHACTLARNLLDLPYLANQAATLSLSIGEIIKTLSDTKERLMILSQHDHTSKPSFAHEIVHQPQMGATSMQEWLSSSYTLTMDALLQAPRSTIPDDVKTLTETNMMDKDAMEALPSRSRKRYSSSFF
ncbi:PREDICTED: uncharacterized protein LOC109326377 [Lupinus angustifolius]|uniref:uncharacterized protein LOC109326377 n=1 Tax=Lupinus angustifolius TaxID=3871 RepID=UPI00092E3F84|nr:PREDICTED: uncharacterized protein LOC109326377 [Lupinus angustifolius]